MFSSLQTKIFNALVNQSNSFFSHDVNGCATFKAQSSIVEALKQNNFMNQAKRHSAGDACGHQNWWNEETGLLVFELNEKWYISNEDGCLRSNDLAMPCF